MSFPKSVIKNIKSLAARYEKGESLAKLAAEATPKAVSVNTIRRAIVEAGGTIRTKPKGKAKTGK